MLSNHIHYVEAAPWIRSLPYKHPLCSVHHLATARNVSLVHVCVLSHDILSYLQDNHRAHLPFRRSLNSYAGAWYRYRIYHESQGHTATTSSSYFLPGLGTRYCCMQIEQIEITEIIMKTKYNLLWVSFAVDIGTNNNHRTILVSHSLHCLGFLVHLGHKTSHPSCSGHGDPIATHG